MKNLSITLAATLATIALAALPTIGFSAGGKVELEHFTPVRTDSSLQRGARLYANYCQGCHTADYQRYSRTARDIGLSDEAMSENLIFTTDADGAPTKVGSLMTNNMTEGYAKKAFGVYPNVGMPHVLADLQGWRKAHFHTDDNKQKVFDGFQKVTEGSLSDAQYDAAISDLVSFLDYLGDPNKEARHSLGIKVMLFLFLLLGLAILLKQEYWKDVPHND